MSKDLAFGSLVLILLLSGSKQAYAGPLYGPPPNGAASNGQVPSEGFSPPDVPTGSVPSPNSPGFNGPNNGVSGSGSSGPEIQPNVNGQQPGMNGQPNGLPFNSSNPNASGQPASGAPTFMNNAMPNSSNPFLPNNVSPGLLSGALENAYIQDGVPQLAAPLMSAVYRPYGLTFFQPDPFQVTPQGVVSLTGTFETDTNINFSTTNPEVGSLYTITPSVYYSNFDDYGYVGLLASASYVQYDTGNIPSYLDETGGISAGTYLGSRVFVGAQDLFLNGSTPQMNGTPMAFLNGIDPYYDNMANAEIGIALTPKITFVQAASDMYFDDSSFGAGIMNIQSLMDTLNYTDSLNFLSLSYIYQQGFFSLFPGFDSNGLSATAMRKVGKTTSLGIGGNASYYLYQQSAVPSNFFVPTTNSPNFYMYSYYGMFNRFLTRSLSVSIEGGWNAITFYGGETFQSPLIDLNLSYTGPKLGLGINVGEYMVNMSSYGIEMGPEKIKSALGYLSYVLSPKTSFFSASGYTYYDFLNPYNYANNFFQNLQPNLSYNGSYFIQTDGVYYRPYTWLMTGLTYSLIDFATNIPTETVIDNQFIAMVTFMWNFK